MSIRAFGAATAAILLGLVLVNAAEGRPPSGRSAEHAGAQLAAHAPRHGAYLFVSRVSSPPAAARAVFSVRGTVVDSGDRAARGLVTVHLMRPGSRPRTVGSTRVRVGGHGATPYAVAVRLPAALQKGSYSLLACAQRYGGSGPLQCATAQRHLLVGLRAAPARQAPRLDSLGSCSSGAHSLSAPGSRVYPEMGNGGYTSVHTDVTLNYDAPTNTFLPGTHVDLTDQATQCLTDFSLDFERTSSNPTSGPNMTVSSVAVNGQPATFAFVQPTYPGDPNGQNDPDPAAHAASLVNPVSATNPNPPACTPIGSGAALQGVQCPANKLVITPSTPVPSGAMFVVTVNYTGRPGIHTDGDGSTEGWFRSAAGAFVTTEPVGTMAWMPLNNHPSAKPTYDFFDTTNTGMTAIGNGELVSTTPNAPDANFPGGSTTWHWHSPEPIANYLVENSIDSFDFSQRLGANGITFYEAQVSAIIASRKTTNKAVMDQQEDITSFQSQFNGPFPFTTDGVIVSTPAASFEEEMQTKITFAGSSISLGTFNHENMHQWFGDNVSEASFNLTFWKEGWATVGEYLNSARTAATAAGGLGTPAGDAAFNTSLVNRFNTTWNAGSSAPWVSAPSNPTAANLFSTATTYTRPATAYLALWQILGKDRMTSVMQAIQHDYAGRSITEAQLEAEFHQALRNQSVECNAKLDSFFTQWFDTAYPSGGGLNKPQITGPGLAGPGFFCAGLQYTSPTAQSYGAPSELSASLTDQNGNPLAGKSVTFSVDGGPPQAATTDADGEATFTPDAFLEPGTHSVAVSFDGAGGYGVTTAAGSLSVSKLDQTIAFDPLPGVTFGALDFDVAPTASSALPVAIAASGDCTSTGMTVHITGAGSCTVTASQPGDAHYNAAPDVAQSFAIAKASQTISFGALDDQTFGNADFGIVATASSGLPVGLVSAGTCTLSDVTSPATVHLDGAGACTITASQAGNDDYEPAADVPRSFAIGKAGQTITFAALAGKTFGDPDFGVAASASSGLDVSFAAAGQCTSSGSTVHLAAAGSCTVTASQGGDDNYTPAPDVARTFAIAKEGQTIAFAALADRLFGPDFTVSATATSGLPVTFAAVAGSACTVNGATVHLLSAGSCGVVASQVGSSDFQAAPSVTQTFRILNSSAGARAQGKDIKPASGGSAQFNVTVTAHGPEGPLSFVGVRTGKGGPKPKLVAARITAFAIAPDGHSAWIAGTSTDHRSFRAYAEDNRAGNKKKGTTDVFRLWVNDVAQTGDGALAAGAVDLSPGR